MQVTDLSARPARSYEPTRVRYRGGMRVTRPQSGAVEELTVGVVAAGSGVAASAVRFYEEHGVIRAVRTSTNQRRFDDSAVPRIQLAKLAQRIGLTVREIADLFAHLPRDQIGRASGRARVVGA